MPAWFHCADPAVLPDSAAVTVKDKERMNSHQRFFNRHHCAQEFSYPPTWEQAWLNCTLVPSLQKPTPGTFPNSPTVITKSGRAVLKPQDWTELVDNCANKSLSLVWKIELSGKATALWWNLGCCWAVGLKSLLSSKETKEQSSVQVKNLFNSNQIQSQICYVLLKKGAGGMLVM